MNNNINLLKYISWADRIMLNAIMNLSKEEVNQPFFKNSGTIKDKILHLVEEYTAWLYDLRSESWKSKIKDIQNMDYEELGKELSDIIEEWTDFVTSSDITRFEIDEGEIIVPIDINQAVFNLVNHSSYHRGQIMLFMRGLGYSVKISDYYWFLINQLNVN